MIEEKKPLVVRISGYYRPFATSLAIISCITIALMMFSTTIDTILRYVFNKPIAGIFELNEVILVVCIFMGITWCQTERGHIRVTMVLCRLPPRATAIIDTIVWCVVLAVVIVLAIQTWDYAMYAYSIKMFRWGKVQMPIWWTIGLVPLGLWLMSVQVILDIWTNIWRLRGKLPLSIPDVVSLWGEKAEVDSSTSANT